MRGEELVPRSENTGEKITSVQRPLLFFNPLLKGIGEFLNCAFATSQSYWCNFEIIVI